MIKEIGTLVKVTWDKKSGISDFGYVASPNKFSHKVGKGTIIIEITQENTLIGRKGIFQFTENLVSVVKGGRRCCS